MLLAGQTAPVRSGRRDAVLGDLSIDLLRLYPRKPCVLSLTEQATPPPWEKRFRAPGGGVCCLAFTEPERNTLMSKRNPTWISDWDPEDAQFWKSTGKAIAQRNLIWSIFAEHLGFSIWLVWSIVATKLPQAGFHYTTDQLFQLVALPGLIGSLIRFPYTFAVTT